MSYNILSSLLFIPFLALVIIFSIMNRSPININLWPFVYEVKVPLYLAMLVGSFFFFLMGAFLAWLPALAIKLKLKTANKKIKELQKEIDETKLKLRPVKKENNEIKDEKPEKAKMPELKLDIK